MILAVAISLIVLVGLLAGRALGVRGAARLHINPRYRNRLALLGITRFEDFLALPAVIVSGHPNRNVARVALGTGSRAIEGFLKREHRVLWRDYLSSFLAGFGFVSRSLREARMLAAVRRAGCSAPEVIAAGEDGHGRAFLLVRTIEGGRSLRDALREGRFSQPAARADRARRIGRELAWLHEAGLHHADLNATHVFVGDHGNEITFIDWQRSRCGRRVSWQARTRDLAALDATLADDLATPRERLRVLSAYLHECGIAARKVTTLRRIQNCSRALQRKRYVREIRSAAVPIGVQKLIWLDGEALCVTPEYLAELQVAGDHEPLPRWLLPVAPSPNVTEWIDRQRLPRRDAPDALLVQRGCDRFVFWLSQQLRGRRFASPELQQAALLFRLQRYGIRVPTLLAMGERAVRPWRLESFLLVEPLAGGTPLLEWLGHAVPAERNQVLRATGALLRRLHDAGCYLAGEMPLVVLRDGQVAVAAVEDLWVSRRHQRRQARQDVETLAGWITQHAHSPRDVHRFLRGYREPDSTRGADLPVRRKPPRLQPPPATAEIRPEQDDCRPTGLRRPA